MPPQRLWNTISLVLVVLCSAVLRNVRSLTTFLHIWPRQKSGDYAPESQKRLAGPVPLGFALTPTCGAVSLVASDQIVTDIVKMPANEAYKSTMDRLSWPESRHIHPPYRTFAELIEDMPRQTVRRFRKRLGYAASPHVAAIAALLKDLKTYAESFLGDSLDGQAVVVALPSVVALYEEDIDDALQHIRLRNLRSRYCLDQPHELNTALIGHDVPTGDFEMPEQSQWVLCVEYTQESLSIEAGQCTFALQQRLDWPECVKTSLYLGYNAAGTPGYWDRISYLIWEAVRYLNDKEKPRLDTVLLIGEAAEDRTFQSNIRRIVDGFQGSHKIYTANPMFVASRGAAMYAARGKDEPPVLRAPPSISEKKSEQTW